jgi:hypothetical protein
VSRTQTPILDRQVIDTLSWTKGTHTYKFGTEVRLGGYDLELPRRTVGNTMNSFDPLAINPVSGTPGVVTFAGVNGTPERAFAIDKNNFGPRLGQLDLSRWFHSR